MSTADTIEDLENLPAGYYTVRLTDSDTIPQITQAEITLSEPRQIRIVGTIHKYPNGYNISVYGACNGMVNLTAEDGVEPYYWLWSDNNLSPNRTSVCAGWFSVLVLDANGCQAAKDGYMKEPSQGDWLLSGNAGTESDINFIGTSDITDFVVKTNNSERLRISGKGDIEFHGDLKLDSASTDTIRLVFVDRDGFLRTYGPGNPSPIAPDPDWNTKGNNQIDDTQQFIGATNGADLVFKTATSFTPATEKMRITQDGLIGIGTVGTTLPPVSSNYKLIVNGKVGFRKAYVKLSGTWPDYVFSGNYKLKSLSELQNYLNYSPIQYVQNGNISQFIPLNYIATSSIVAEENVDPATDQPTGVYEIKAGANVTFTAGDYIHLTNGFYVSGGDFHAVINENLPVPVFCNANNSQNGGNRVMQQPSDVQTQNLNSISVLPNPNHGTFTISIKGSNSIKAVSLFDVTGRSIYYKNSLNEKSHEIQLTSELSGLLIGKVENDKGEIIIIKGIVE